MQRAVAWIRLTPLAVLVLLQTAAHAAMPGGWIAVHVRGTVVSLVGGEWQEVDRGVVLVGETVRTLRSGRLTLQLGDGRIGLGGDTAIQLGADQGGVATVRQYSGVLLVEAGAAGPRRIAVETPVLAIVASEGVVSITFDDGVAVVRVESGSASVIDRLHGDEAVLAAGQAATGSSAGIDVSGAGDPPVAADGKGNVVSGATTPPAGALQAGGAAKGNAAGKETSGNGNSDNGNGGGNGKAKGQN